MRVADEVKFYRALFLLAMFALCCSWIYFGIHTPTPCDEGLTTVKRDTVYVKDTTPKLLKTGSIVATSTVSAQDYFKQNKNKGGIPTNKTPETPVNPPVLGEIPTESIVRVKDPEREDKTFMSPCDSVRTYLDSSVVANSHGIYHYDTILGKRLGSSLWFVNLKPEIQTTITKVRKQRWKVYAGALLSYSPRHPDRWGVSPGVLVAIPKVGAINYQYDVKNNEHTAGFYVLIRIKK